MDKRYIKALFIFNFNLKGDNLNWRSPLQLTELAARTEVVLVANSVIQVGVAASSGDVITAVLFISATTGKLTVFPEIMRLLADFCRFPGHKTAKAQEKLREWRETDFQLRILRGIKRG